MAQCGVEQIYEDRCRMSFRTRRGSGWAATSGDVNNDGLIDLIASDMAATSHYRDKVMMGNMDDIAWFLDWAEPRQFMRNALYINTGAGACLRARFYVGVAGTDWTWTPRLEDFDNDGWVDLFVTNGVLRDLMNSDLTGGGRKVQARLARIRHFWHGQPMRKEKNLAFRNARDLKFENSRRMGPRSRGRHLRRGHRGFRQRWRARSGRDQYRCAGGPLSQPLDRRPCREGAPRRHRQQPRGLGATVPLTRGMASNDPLRHVTRGFLSASDPLVHFGLGAEQRSRDSPSLAKRLRQTFADPPTDSPPSTEGGPQSAPTPPTAPLFTAPMHCAVPAREPPFDDFQREPLLPNKLSRRAPAWHGATPMATATTTFGSAAPRARATRPDGVAIRRDAPHRLRGRRLDARTRAASGSTPKETVT